MSAGPAVQPGPDFSTLEVSTLTDAFEPVSYEQWRAQVEQELAGAPFEKKLVARLYEGLELQPVYTDADWPHANATSGHAGIDPMTRGSRLLGTTLTGWDVRQEHAFPLIDPLNKAILDDLFGGATSILLRFDTAARSGLDADDPAAAQLVGRDGAAIATVADLDDAFRDVHLEMITVALEAGAAFLPAAGLVMALWDKRGVDASQARAAFNADPLAVLARDAKLPMPLNAAFDQLTDLASRVGSSYPHATTVRVGSAPYHHAGATASQDLAFSMATAVEYMRAMTTRGMDASDAAKQLLFSFAVGCNQFLAIAKLRAARRLWNRVASACAVDEDARSMTIHARPSKRVLTHRDPWVNLLRNTTCCFAAGVAGADTITSTPFDDPLGPPSPHARRIARNTQVILQEESHVHNVADPSGGSWFIERLTDDLAKEAWAIFQQIERNGGMAAALQSGWIAEKIDSAFAPRQANIATRRDAILGVSEFPNPRESSVERPRPSHLEVLGAARQRLAAHRASTDASSALEAVSNAKGAARAAAVADAAAAGASIGQLARSLGTGEPTTLDAVIAPHPYAAPFEELRDATDAFEKSAGYRPAVFLANIGTPAEFNARAGFATSLLEAGGLSMITNSGFSDPTAAASAFAASGASIAVICSTDEKYENVVTDLAPKLHAAGARTVILAGRPAANEQAWRGAGVDRFIYVKCDAVTILRELLTEEGVL
ncbi:MAG: methylmalonyl-CoA mutase [Phycisphaerae bacterium]|nr:methylmalonyl-CoA mutase [Phycisphaerae bacterium]